MLLHKGNVVQLFGNTVQVFLYRTAYNITKHNKIGKRERGEKPLLPRNCNADKPPCPTKPLGRVKRPGKAARVGKARRPCLI